MTRHRIPTAMPMVARAKQRGAALVVGLVMLTLITVVVASTFTSSHSNTQAIGNMQSRDEAIAAANKAIEQVLSSDFEGSEGETISVDINHDDTPDYDVTIGAPTCESATRIAGASGDGTSVTFETPITSATDDNYQTVWDIDANVQDLVSGTRVRVHQGVRSHMSESDYNEKCNT